MSEHEPEWMRDKRLRDEEARMVQLEGNVAATKTSVEAIREMFEEERRMRRRVEEAVLSHETDDASKFSSIDSRLQGTQTQLSTIAETLKRIESKVDGQEPRIKSLEENELGRTAVQRFLKNAWAQVGIGASIGGALAAIYFQLAT